LTHEVVALHFSIGSLCQAYRAGIVYANVYAAEFIHSFVDSIANLLFQADVTGYGQGLSAAALDFRGCRMYGARQFGMLLNRLGGNYNVGAVTGCAQPN